MAVETMRWTRAELARLPDDGNRYEVLDGRLLVTPQASLAHQRVATDLVFVLREYVRPRDLADVVGPGAVPFGDNELQPDVHVIPGPRRSGTWEDLPVPILVAEVLSASTRRRDLGVKLAAYRGLGVNTIWLVDFHARLVHVGEGDVALRTESDRLEWSVAGAPGPLVIELREFFRRANP